RTGAARSRRRSRGHRDEGGARDGTVGDEVEDDLVGVRLSAEVVGGDDETSHRAGSGSGRSAVGSGTVTNRAATAPIMVSTNGYTHRYIRNARPGSAPGASPELYPNQRPSEVSASPVTTPLRRPKKPKAERKSPSRCSPWAAASASRTRATTRSLVASMPDQAMPTAAPATSAGTRPVAKNSPAKLRARTAKAMRQIRSAP